MQHTPFFDVGWDFRRDSSLSGQPIRIGGVEYTKGLAVHSKTLLEYNLAGRYRLFETVVGIDDSSGPLGDAVVRVLADQRPLFEATVRAGQPGKPVSVNVQNADKLVLEVDYGNRLDLGDHVVFANARLIK
jgi:hypothetical protein